jgi:protein-S-isoprenylcysteine O-methyltransferase Ste14
MKASAIEFRLRMLIMAVIVTSGFWAPWIEGLGLGSRRPLLEWLALELSRLGLLNFSAAAPAVIVLGALFAAIGAILRVWGAAWLGPGTVLNRDMKAGAVMADGPYRYVRNPLYLGLWFMLATVSMLMPAMGALFALIAAALFLFRLILGEEAFLAGQLGEPYQVYLQSVPRLIPRLRTNLERTGMKPHWRVAFLSELNPIFMFVTMSVLSWRYDYVLMVKGILIGFGGFEGLPRWVHPKPAGYLSPKPSKRSTPMWFSQISA